MKGFLMNITNKTYDNLVNNTSFNYLKNENASMFDTSRFTDVTTNRHLKNGTTVYRDNANPGVYYTSHASGYVRRSVRTSVKEVTSQSTNIRYSNLTYQINPRVTTKSYDGKNFCHTLLISQGNQRLARIQEMADKFNSKRPSLTSIYTRGDTSIIITPDV